MSRSGSLEDLILVPADGYVSMFEDAPAPTADDLRGLPRVGQPILELHTTTSASGSVSEVLSELQSLPRRVA